MNLIKILAEGSYKSFLWLEINDKVFCISIPRSLYYELKNSGVPTSQSLRGKKNEIK